MRLFDFANVRQYNHRLGLGSNRRCCNSVFDTWLELDFCLQSKQFSDFVNCSRIIARSKHSLYIRCAWLAFALDLVLVRSWCTVIKVILFQFQAFYVWKTYHAKFGFRELCAELFERFLEDDFIPTEKVEILFFDPWLELALCFQSKQFSDSANCSRIIARSKHSLNIRCV